MNPVSLLLHLVSYPDRLGLSGKHFPTVIVLHLFVAYIFPPKCRNFFPLKPASVACLQRKIQLSGFCAYPNGSPSQLIRISGALLYPQSFFCWRLRGSFTAMWNMSYITCSISRYISSLIVLTLCTTIGRNFELNCLIATVGRMWDNDHC